MHSKKLSIDRRLLRLGSELFRHNLQQPQVVFRGFQILRHVPVAYKFLIDREEFVNDRNPVNRVLCGIWTDGLGEKLVYELANAADAFPADHPKVAAFSKPADRLSSQSIGIVARIEDDRSVVKVKVVGGFQFRSHVREL